MQIRDDMFESPCYIIDFLPEQVSKNCRGQFFKVENYFLNNYDRYGLRDRFIRVILKAMCYYPISVQWEKWIEKPAPEQIAEIIDTIMENHSGDVNILFTRMCRKAPAFRNRDIRHTLFPCIGHYGLALDIVE